MHATTLPKHWMLLGLLLSESSVLPKQIQGVYAVFCLELQESDHAGAIFSVIFSLGAPRLNGSTDLDFVLVTLSVLR